MDDVAASDALDKTTPQSMGLKMRKFTVYVRTVFVIYPTC